jgi:hypothetical protein
MVNPNNPQSGSASLPPMIGRLYPTPTFPGALMLEVNVLRPDANPDDNRIVGRLFLQDTPPAAVIDRLDANPPRQGTGTRLLQGFIAESKFRGAAEVRAPEVSTAALGLLGKLADRSAIHLFEPATWRGDNWLPLTIEQAIEGRVSPDTSPVEVPHHFGVHVSLGSIDTSNMERPSTISLPGPDQV